MRLCRSILLLLLAAPVAAQTTPEYLHPSQTVPHGSAPGMKVKLLSAAGPQREYAVILSPGDEALSGLTKFAADYHVEAAHFTAIGALKGATLGWFDPVKKMYKTIPVDQQVEVLSMVGDIAVANGKPAVHTHMVVGLPDGTTRGGHVIAAYVNPTLEVMVTVDRGPLYKKYDPATTLTLIDPDAKQ